MFWFHSPKLFYIEKYLRNLLEKMVCGHGTTFWPFFLHWLQLATESSGCCIGILFIYLFFFFETTFNLNEFEQVEKKNLKFYTLFSRTFQRYKFFANVIGFWPGIRSSCITSCCVAGVCFCAFFYAQISCCCYSSQRVGDAAIVLAWIRLLWNIFFFSSCSTILNRVFFYYIYFLSLSSDSQVIYNENTVA